MSTYVKGAAVRLEATFEDPLTSTKIDPGTVRLRIKKPDSTLVDWTFGTNPEVVKDAVGLYHAVVDASQSGTWLYYWNSTGNGQAANEGQFTVKAARATI